MNGGARRRLGAWLLLLPVAVLIGCEDVGLPGRNTPLEEATTAAWRYEVYDVGVTPPGTSEAMVHYTSPAADPGAQAAEMGQHYLPSAETIEIPEHLLQPVAGMGGAQLFALATDDPPYHRLYTPSMDQPLRAGGPRAYHPMMPVPEPAMRYEAGAEDSGTMDHGTGH